MSCPGNTTDFTRKAKWILFWVILFYILSSHTPQVTRLRSVSWVLVLSAITAGIVLLFSRKQRRCVLYLCEFVACVTFSVTSIAIFNMVLSLGSVHDEFIHDSYHYHYQASFKWRTFFTRALLFVCLFAIAALTGHISHEAKRLRQYYRLRRERNLLNVSSSQHSQNSSNQQQSERVILVKRVNDAFYRELDMNKLSTLQSQNLSIFSKILAVFCGHETPNASIRIVKNGEVLVCCDDDLRRLKHGDRLEVTFL